MQHVTSSVKQNNTTAHIIQSDQEALALVKQFRQQFAQHASQRDLNRQLPFEEIEQLSQSGLLAITVPKQYGGAEVSNVTLARVIAELSAADGSIGQIPQNHFYALEVLRHTGTEQQKQKFYAEILAGKRLGNALAEFKTANASIKTTRIRPEFPEQSHNDRYVIQGEKFYCTGNLFAHRIPTLVQDDQQNEYLAFVNADSTGLERIDNWTGFGQRTTGSGTVRLNQVLIEQDELIPFDLAFSTPSLVGPIAQLMHAAIEVGIARAAFEETLVRVRAARPWIDAQVDFAHQDPLTLYELGRIAADVRASELLLAQAGAVIDAAKNNIDEQHVAEASIAVAKVRAHSTETALKTASKLIELAGSRGSQRNDNLDRYWRNARVHTLHDPVRWKYYFIAQYELNGVLPPRRGTL
ncbi:SfnB family sulfur acquisition oxidoreductase [Acinetobacter larvae]|uniref:SfnB family sulfur acquisition oxidoreductase n=1 Tax=Acinetobacter larvae TaxID=1789224 RepID=A0A1B2M3W6_9GAMM|nr:SfnB family sulfur acquisition oxidoreductase [Acinetobacter larvae]